ncbi:EAL domain-containing protein [Sphingomonas sp. C3-2]|uniref:bifunctional diguanylate cyclase/phosphodiesterase n=1 Tax=Sphingomonas sp. C3-2 TaxID=3062169 RepID=UPI00294B1D7A|nr:EAL domain-containing protein [Sphingomonas sp. C3-2]WOK36094.1 EAL domain-containing protein [Sphingomonas sp. C3-2]
MKTCGLVDGEKDRITSPIVVNDDDYAADQAGELTAYKAALEELAIVAICDRNGRISHVNDQFCKISQYERSELIGQKHSLINSGYHPRDFFAAMWKTITSGQRWRGEICNLAKNGEYYWVDTTIAPILTASGRIDGFISIRFDITKRKLAESALMIEVNRRGRAEAMLREIVETIPDGIAAYDSDDKLLLSNRAFREFYAEAAPAITEGASRDSIEQYAAQHGQFRPQPRLPAWDRPRRRKGDAARANIRQLRDGRWLQLQERHSQAGRLITICTDVSGIKNAELLIKHQAERDSLTGLANRATFQNALLRVLAGTERVKPRGALLLIDLDQFKTVNDRLGHDAGDDLLIEIGQRLERAVRGQDVVARLGGDEFAVILGGLSTRAEMLAAVERIQAGFQTPVKLGRREVSISCSIGIATFPRDGRSPKALLKNADMALYDAKAHGRNTHSFFRPALRARLIRRDDMADALRKALDDGQIDVALQPQVSMASGDIVGFEALARWTHKGRDISPAEFIPVSEESGLVGLLGDMVLDRAMARLMELRAKGLAGRWLSVNFAAAQLKAEGFVERLSEKLARQGLTPSDLDIEVTEKVLFDSATGRIRQTLTDLHGQGFKITLDDFGTGYASLSHLQQFPVSRLKIDQSFVRNLTANPMNAAIPIAIVNLAHNLGMDVVAEGIETRAQFDILKQHGCDLGQGYLLGRPLRGAELTGFATANIGGDAAG